MWNACARLAEELYQEVIDVGGSITGEHGYGLSRTSFLKQQAGPLYEVFRAIKQIFDPENTFNPGKIVGDDPELMIRNLQPAIKTQPSPPAPADHARRSACNAQPGRIAVGLGSAQGG